MLIGALIWVLHFTHPTVSDSLGPCEDLRVPVEVLTDLDHEELWGWGRYAANPQHLMDVPATHKEGTRDSLAISVEGVWTLYLVACDHAGNRSCQSNSVTVGIPSTSVPPLPNSLKTTYYDVQGRRLPIAPKAPGIYFRRDGLIVRRIVILAH